MTFAFIFNDVGFGEWFVLLAVILVVVGPKRLPEAARKFGSYYSKFRRAADAFKRQLLDMDTAFERAVTEAENETNQAFSVDGTDGVAAEANAAVEEPHPSENGGTVRETESANREGDGNGTAQES